MNNECDPSNRGPAQPNAVQADTLGLPKPALARRKAAIELIEAVIFTLYIATPEASETLIPMSRIAILVVSVTLCSAMHRTTPDVLKIHDTVPSHTHNSQIVKLPTVPNNQNHPSISLPLDKGSSSRTIDMDLEPILPHIPLTLSVTAETQKTKGKTWKRATNNSGRV
ncbi:pleiotropic drug resistance 1 [Striga asiatica]|uniref:Pleiotropic drug resistance 1 n=1 Tax=Striga asiatica TaxID=4170 RepID=A0A5A7QXF5_STRAF|nr:pleiotropic drug resistance 1 [Striga asiatica]